MVEDGVLMELIEHKFYEPKVGEVVSGKVVHISKRDVIVDIGAKSQGAIPITEFKKEEKIEVGQEIPVYIEALETEEGYIKVSKLKAEQLEAWRKLREAFENDGTVEGEVKKVVKGGFMVDIMSVWGFLPMSHVGQQLDRPEKLLGTTLKFKILRCNEQRRNLVVSHREYLEEEERRRREEIVRRFQIGAVKEGVVKSITHTGAIVQIEDIEAFMHIGDMTWTRISHPSEVLKLDDKVKVKILEVDPDTGKVFVGMKQLMPHPWENIEKKYPVGSVVKGKVVAIVNYGAFIELEKGIEGLLHISELSWTRRIKHPSEVLSVGDVVEVKVLEINKEEQKISLSLKQLMPDPWEVIETKHPIGSIVMGRVELILPYGVVVALPDELEGFIHISDISWTQKIEHPSEVFRKGQRVKARVLGYDREMRRIILGYKQLTEDPLVIFQRHHPVGSIIRAKVVALLEKGILVDVGGGLKGFMPMELLMESDPKKWPDTYRVGKTIQVGVKDINPSRRRLILSEKMYEEWLERQLIHRYRKVKSPVKEKEERRIELPEELDKLIDESEEGKEGKEGKEK